MTFYVKLTGSYKATYNCKTDFNRKYMSLTGVSFPNRFRSEEKAVFINERVVMEAVQMAVHFGYCG